MLDISPLDGIRSPFGQRRGGGPAPAFSPSTLYSSGSQGIWLDPSDLTTMFSDRAGTMPVTTPGTVVGLRLDKSKGLTLGAELVTNGDFASGTGWTLSTGWTIGSGTLNVSGAAFTQADQGISLVAGRTYQVTYSITAYTSGSANAQLTGGTAVSGVVRSAAGTYTEFLVAGSGNTTLRVQARGSGFIGTIDNISVRELPGNHATAPTDAARPTYGVEPKGGRRNLLTYSEDYSNAVWSKVGVTASGQRITANAATGTAYAEIAYANAPASAVTISAVFPSTAGRNRYVWMGDRGVSPLASATFDLNSVSVVGKATAVTASVVTLPDGSVKCSVTYTRASVGTSTPQFALAGATYTSDRPSLTWAGGEFLDAKMQFELGSTATNYQKVTTAYDVTESGVPSCHYVQYDGSDDSMSTAAIDFTATDKMSVFAGVRKLSDAATGMLVELSTTFGNAGSFAARAPRTAAEATFDFNSGGTISRSAVSPATYAAPTTNVLTGLGDIGGDLVTLRLNGTQVGQATTDQGTGNFGNYPLFIGRRNNATLPFNGKDYGIIVVGKAASAGEITDTETWLAARTSEVSL